ncbi:hypothetical protein AGR5A_Lc80083 [Agrobacterium genomosp. 5 str. CFBP 6626]|nr:hypothetical protein AGR5A_Lc80083 [Agrobacterium genomosp. 5 str. CFBP 6626]
MVTAISAAKAPATRPFRNPSASCLCETMAISFVHGTVVDYIIDVLSCVRMISRPLARIAAAPPLRISRWPGRRPTRRPVVRT